MTGITTSISNLVSSILQTIQGIFSTLLSSVQGVLSVFATALGSIADLSRGLVELVLGNIVLIGILVAAFVGYSAYAQRRGQTLQGSAARGKKKL